MSQKGKITFFTLILLIILIYGAFVAIKLLGANFQESQIKKEVYDTIGIMRGSDFTPERGAEAIRKVLRKNDNVIFDENEEDAIEINLDKRVLSYYFRFQIEIDLLLFKQMRLVEIEDAMERYGG
jgi:hypothetical protein